MPQLVYEDHAKDPQRWAQGLGISREAIEVYLASDVIDLHIDSFIWTRIFGYDLTKRHDSGLLNARFYSQSDLPRLREARITGGVWVITSNPLRPAVVRARVFVDNLRQLRAILESCPADVAIARNVAEYERARAAGKHAAFFGVQGGNALDRDADALDLIEDDLVVRITLVHLSTSKLGRTSSPLAFLGKNEGLSDAGKDYVRRLNAKKIFVDLAHINRRGFFDAVAVHDKTQPLIVTHTGIAGVFRHWRNVDDEQLRAIADTGGTIGVMYQSSFLGDSNAGGRATSIVDHLEHIVKTVGEDYASLGSDWDGAIITPRDMPTVLELPKIVQIMLDRGWKAERIQKILGKNFLRALKLLRG
jgi:membrane dipeptidase